MYRSITVVDVGDGACSVLRDWWWFGDPPARVAVIDCGTWRGSPQEAAGKLLAALGPDLPAVRQMVVSHWDADHWEGLAALADHPAAHGSLAELTVSSPAMPQRLRRGILAFVTGRSATGTIAPLLRSRLQPLMGLGARGITLEALAWDDSITLAGRDMQVLWPPPVLADQDYRKITGALDAVDELAGDLASEGYPDLANNLRDLERQLADQDFAAREPSGRPEKPEEPVLATDRAEEDAAHDDVLSADADLPIALPDDPRKKRRVQQVFRRVRAINNDLSLILLAEDGTLLALGDAGPRVVAQALARYGSLALGPRAVVLAPHHGSIPVPSSLPPAAVCIAQAGGRHAANWPKHTRTHAGSRCMSTATSGTVTVLV